VWGQVAISARRSFKNLSNENALLQFPIFSRRSFGFLVQNRGLFPVSPSNRRSSRKRPVVVVCSSTSTAAPGSGGEEDFLEFLPEILIQPTVEYWIRTSARHPSHVAETIEYEEPFLLILERHVQVRHEVQNV